MKHRMSQLVDIQAMVAASTDARYHTHVADASVKKSLINNEAIAEVLAELRATAKVKTINMRANRRAVLRQ